MRSKVNGRLLFIFYLLTVSLLNKFQIIPYDYGYILMILALPFAIVNDLNRLP